MADPISTFSGISSGFNWRDLIDQLMAAETAQKINPIKTQIAQTTNRISAWGQFSALVSGFQAKANALAAGTPFQMASASAPVSPTSGAALLGVTADPGAPAGSYGVEVLQLAQANKVGSAYQASTSAALGLAGDFTVNGQRVEVVAADSLAAIRDKINAVNAGTAASRVSAATITSGTRSRLVMTAQDLGAAGVELVDGASGVLKALGVLAASGATENRTSDGSLQSYALAASGAALGTQLGMAMPGPTTMLVNGAAVALDLATDSLDTLAAKIAATGASATVVAESRGSVTRYRLVTDAAIAADPGDAAASARALDVVGFTEAARTGIAQVRTQTVAMTDAAAGNVAASGGTLLTDLGTGAAAGVAVDDVFTLQGTRADGTTFTQTLTVGATSTMTDLLAQLNGASGFGGSSRASVVTLSGGKLVLTDATGGTSLATLSITSNNAGGGTLTFGSMAVTTEGVAREIVAGANALVRIDGTLIEKASNTLADAIPSTVLSLTKAEPGTTLAVTVAQDTQAAVKAVQDLAAAYNALADFVQKETLSTTGAFANGGGALRTSFRTLTENLLTQVPGLATTAPYKTTSSVGLSFDKTGRLSVNTTTLTTALTTDRAAVEQLFATKGLASSGALEFVSAGAKATAGAYAVTITQAATLGSATGVGFVGSYGDDGIADTMTLTDLATGKTGAITLAAGDTVEAVVSKLNALFSSKAMSLVASQDGGQVKVAAKEYGSRAGFTVAYTAGGADGSASLGLAAGSYAGQDVAGTINGLAATGSGQTLTGATGTAVEGLILRYTGATTGAIGSVDLSRGVGQLLADAAARLTTAGTGTISRQQDTLGTTISALQRRQTDVQARLDRRRKQMTQQFSDMELIVTKIQQQMNRISGQLGALAKGPGTPA